MNEILQNNTISILQRQQAHKRAGCRFFLLFLIMALPYTGCTRIPPIHQRENKFSHAFVMGRRYQGRGVLNEALPWFEEAHRHYNYHTNIYVHMADVLMQLGKHTEAEYYLRYALKYFGHDYRSYFEYGAFLAYQNNSDAAIYWRIARSLVPPQIKRRLNDDIERIKEIQKTAPQYIAQQLNAAYLQTAIQTQGVQKAVELTATLGAVKRIHILTETASLLTSSGNWQDAGGLWEEVYRLEADPEHLIQAGNSYYRSQAYADAIRLYLLYADTGERPSTAWYNLGLIYELNGIIPRADYMFAKAGERYTSQIQAVKSMIANDRIPEPED